MICISCSNAGFANAIGSEATARLLHEACAWPGGGCFCQHGVGKEWINGGEVQARA